MIKNDIVVWLIIGFTVFSYIVGIVTTEIFNTARNLVGEYEMSMQYPVVGANTGVAAASPSIVTSSDQSSIQALMLQASMANMKPDQAAQMQAAIAAAARDASNRAYMELTERKLAPALTNGAPTQAYVLSTPLTFNLSTALNGFCEGLLIKQSLNYTLAAGTSAVYGLTPGGMLSTIDTVEVRYNKSQHKVRPQAFKPLAQMGALEDYAIPESVLSGSSQAFQQAYLNTAMPVTAGAQSANIEYYIPFCLLRQNDPRGLLPIMVGDTGIQVIVNTPMALFGTDPIQNALYAVSGSGHAVSAISGTIQVSAVYRDGDVLMSTAKMPFDMTAVDGTFQMQIDQVLTPLVAGTTQRTKINIQGRHYFLVLFVVDGVQSSTYATNANINYLELAKDGVGGNTFWKYGTQTNLDVRDWLYLKRLDFKQDVDQGVLPLVYGPVARQGDPHLKAGKAYLDNTRSGWPDFRYGINLTSVGTVCTARIEPHVFYINPVGLLPV